MTDFLQLVGGFLSMRSISYNPSMSVLQLTRTLTERPDLPVIPGITVRNYAGEADIEIWLAIRQQAFRTGPNPARNSSPAEFQADFLAAWWWSPSRMWLAEADGLPIGTVTLAERGPPGNSRPVVHWLAVRPRWRNRGIGRLLMARLEAACWEVGRKQIWLETHDQWEAAVRLYRALGYEPV